MASQRVFRPCEVNIQTITIRQNKRTIYTVIPTPRAVKEFDNDNDKLCDVMYRNATEMYLTRVECQAYCDELNKNKGEKIKMATKITTPSEYQKLAMRTCSFKSISHDMLAHAVFGLASEAGEVAGILQKKYQGHKIEHIHLAKELGDCLWMIAEACTAMGWTMEEVMEANIEKLKARYPDGFEVERSLHREEGDI